MITISGVAMPSHAHKYIRGQVDNISPDTALLLQYYLSHYADVQVKVLLPRAQLLDDVLPANLVRWLERLSVAEKFDLYLAAVELQYAQLREVMGLSLSSSKLDELKFVLRTK